MRYTSIAFATLLSFASTPAFSQLENLLRGMEKFAEDLEKGQQAPNAPSQQQQAPQQQTEPQPQPQQQSQPQPQTQLILTMSMTMPPTMPTTMPPTKT